MSKARTKISQGLRTQILTRDGHKCRICGDTANLCIDHIIPKSRGGKDTEDNLQILCRTCNAVKQNFDLTNEKVKEYIAIYEQRKSGLRLNKVLEINYIIRTDLFRKGKI